MHLEGQWMIQYTYIARSNAESPRNDTASIAELPDSRLMAVWHKYKPGPEGPSDFGLAAIAAKHSLDGGLTWKDERILVDVEEGDINVQAPARCLLPTGELLLICLQAHERGSTSMLLFRSRNYGQSFIFDNAIWERSNGQWLQGGNSHLLCLSSGRLLLAFHGGTGDQWSQHNVIRCFYSDDEGKSWTLGPATIDLPMRGAMEASVAELSDGALYMTIRTQLGSEFLTYSDDRGENWSLPQATLRAPESSSCLRRIPGTDNLVLFWNDSLYDPSHHHYGLRTPLSAAVSKDRGKSWRKIGDIDGGDTMLTNLGCTFTSDGTALVTYLHINDPEVQDGKFIGRTGQGWHAGHTGLKCAIIERDWFT
ncbi:MAG: exo-alpha-sialidase [Spirochaetales bacterium]|jgi:sialidase-1|nr:exo-alpha-sialidase [Spirochaetales bacterium]